MVYWYFITGRPFELPSMKYNRHAPLTGITVEITGAPGNVYGTNEGDRAENADMPSVVLVAIRMRYPWLFTRPLVRTIGDVGEEAQKKFVPSKVY
jgi:hypothetical protein